MISKPQIITEYLVTCEICMKEIPLSEAKSEEACDYIIYYCGLDCYETWVTQKQPVTGEYPEYTE